MYFKWVVTRWFNMHQWDTHDAMLFHYVSAFFIFQQSTVFLVFSRHSISDPVANLRWRGRGRSNEEVLDFRRTQYFWSPILFFQDSYLHSMIWILQQMWIESIFIIYYHSNRNCYFMYSSLRLQRPRGKW